MRGFLLIAGLVCHQDRIICFVENLAKCCLTLLQWFKEKQAQGRWPLSLRCLRQQPKPTDQAAEVSVKPANPNTRRQTWSVAPPRGHVHGRVLALLLDQGVKSAGGLSRRKRGVIGHNEEPCQECLWSLTTNIWTRCDPSGSRVTGCFGTFSSATAVKGGRIGWFSKWKSADGRTLSNCLLSEGVPAVLWLIDFTKVV